MYSFHISLLFFFVHSGYSDWVSEWLMPVQQQYETVQNNHFKLWNENKDLRISPGHKNLPVNNMYIEEVTLKSISTDFATLIETAITKATRLIESLKKEISSELKNEHLLKDGVANGRLGVTIATVTMIGRLPRIYIIRNESWSICDGNVIYSYYDKNASKWRFNLPKCSGREITTNRDTCIFNSIIKYTIPTMRRSMYSEDDYLCQKTSFNNSFEKYMSVPPSIIKETCKNDDISKSISEILLECGPRIITEYTLYPYSLYINTLPAGYCYSDGTCKLTVAWHISNVSIENFEFFEIDGTFKKYFINQKSSTDF